MARNFALELMFKSKLVGSHNTLNALNSSPSHPVGLGVVGRRSLAADFSHLRNPDSDELESSGSEGLQGWFVVALQDQLRVAQPLDDLNNAVCCKVFLVRALPGNDVAKDVLRSGATDHETLDQRACGPRGFDAGFSSRVVWVVELVAGLHLVTVDEEVIQPDHGSAGSSGAEMRVSTTATEHAVPAPFAGWNM